MSKLFISLLSGAFFQGICNGAMPLFSHWDHLCENTQLFGDHENGWIAYAYLFQ
jgi:hypothetical protein